MSSFGRDRPGQPGSHGGPAIMGAVSRWPTHLAVAVLLTVAVGGIVVVALVPDNSKIAVGLGVAALVIAAGNYATNPDWDELARDVKRLRKIADNRPPAP